ncbi:hypothetical protein Tco_0293883 [Tanacetum coccineum]
MGCFADSLVLFRKSLMEGCKNDVPNRGVDCKERCCILLRFGDLVENTMMILFLLRHGTVESCIKKLLEDIRPMLAHNFQKLYDPIMCNYLHLEAVIQENDEAQSFNEAEHSSETGSTNDEVDETKLSRQCELKRKLKRELQESLSQRELLQQALIGELAQGELIQGELVQGKLIQGELVQGELLQGELIQGELDQGELIQGEIVQGELLQGELIQGELVQGELIQGELIQGELVQGELIQGELIQGELLQGELIQVNQQTHLAEFPQIDSGLAVPMFKQRDDPIDAINKMMSFLSTVVTSHFSTTNNQLRNSSNPRQQATIHDGRVTVQPVQGRQSQNKGCENVLTAKGKVIWQDNTQSQRGKGMLHDPKVAEGPVLILQDGYYPQCRFSLDDLDAYDSDCDDFSTSKAVLMANLSTDQMSTDQMTSLTATSVWNLKLSLKMESYRLLKSFSKLEQHCISLELAMQLNNKFFQKNDTSVNQTAPIFDHLFKLNNLKAELQAKDTTIKILKANIKQQAAILREIVEQAKSLNPSDSASYSACKYVKLIQELLGYVRDTWPDIHKPRVSRSTKSSRSKSTDNKKNDRILLDLQVVVQIVLWYLDSGCSKHMTGDRSQLTNFFHKFLGTVKFGNDQIAKIMGYGDYRIGNITILRVYYVEGLGHNLFSVGQFCDSDLEVAFRKHTCFVRNLEGVDLLSGSRETNLSTLSIRDMMASSLICLLSKASKTMWKL